MSKEKEINLPYGVGHSKFYSKSVIADFLVDRDEDNKIVQINSDVNLLLRQKTIHRKIGIDNLRDYVDNLMINDKSQGLPEFSDDELFQLIEPKSVNNLTSCYQYAKYLQDHSKEVKAKLDELKKQKQDYDAYLKKYHQPSKTD